MLCLRTLRPDTTPSLMERLDADVAALQEVTTSAWIARTVKMREIATQNIWDQSANKVP